VGRALLVLMILTVPMALAKAHEPESRDELAARLANHRADALPDSVEAIVARLLPEARTRPDSSLIRLLLLERGKTRVAYGQAATGEQDLREAGTLAAAQGDGAAVREAWRYLAEACRQQGRHHEAADILGELELAARAAGDAFHAGKALHGLGRLRYRARDLAAADSLYALALPYLEAVADSAGMASLHNGLGNTRGARGAYRDAAEHYHQAARLARAGQSRSLEAMARNNLAGVAMIIGDPAVAAAEYRQARDIQAELGLWRRMGAPWRNLAQALTDLGHLDEAHAELIGALDLARSQALADDEAYTLVRLATLELARGEAATALAHCRQATGLGPGVAFEVVLNARLRAAEALLELGDGAAAAAQLDTATVALDGRDHFTLSMMLVHARAKLLRTAGRHQEMLTVLGPGLELTAAAQVARYRLPLLVVAADAWFALGQDDSTAACLMAAERLWEQERVLPTDPHWRERRGHEAQQLFALQVALAMRHGDQEAAFAAVQRYKARTLFERILGPGEHLPASTTVPPPVTLAVLQRDVLRPGELLLDILSGPSGGWLFAVAPETCLVWPLPGDERWGALLDPLLAQVAHPFEAHDGAAAAQVLAALLGQSADAAQPAPEAMAAARDLITAAETIIVCPDGPLHRIPFAIVMPQADIRRVPSATILAHLRERPPAAAGTGRILALAGQQNADHRRLQGAVAEVERLQRRFRQVTVVGASRDVELDLRRLDLSAYDLLHLACHAEVDPQRPWNSALILGTAHAPVALRAGEVAARALQARLAVLSSCSSAGGGILSGEGVIGLAAGFLSADVPAVVATLWPVDDAATARFMEGFYDELASGASPAAALAAARLRLRTSPATAHPFYWAAFVLVGDGQAGLDLRPRRSGKQQLAAAGMVGLAVVLMGWRVRIRRQRRSYISA